MFSQASIKIKIRGSSFALLALLAVVGGVGLFGFSRLGHEMKVSADQSHLALALADLRGAASEARLSTRDYIVSGGDPLLASEFEARGAEAKKHVKVVSDGLKDNDKIKLLEKVTSAIVAYDKAFTDIKGKIGERIAFEATLAELGPVMDKSLEAILAYASDQGSTSILIPLYTGTRHLQRARVMSARYGDKETVEYYDKALTEFNLANNAFNSMKPILHESQIPQLSAIIGAIESYADGLKKLRPIIEHRLALEKVMADAWIQIKQNIEVLDRALRDEQEAALVRADGSRTQSTWIMLASMISAVLVGLLLSAAISRAILSQVQVVISAVTKISSGDLTVEAAVVSQDELGHMTEQLNQMAKNLRGSVLEIAASASQLGAASEELSTVSHSMSAAATQTSSQATDVSAAVSQVDANIQGVASASEEMAATIDEVARNASEAAQIASAAAQSAATTKRTVAQLSASSEQVGQVVALISRIAEQTNLLALNATIEAARAGSAGAGFAVVANEVKELANETTHSTAQIATQIQTIQSDARSAVAAIEEVAKIIARVDDISNTIAGAVQQQTATTQEISRGAHEAADGSHHIAASVHGMAEAAEITSTSSGYVLAASSDLAGMAEKLSSLVAQFRC